MALLMKILALDILSPLIRGGVKAGINNLKNLLLCSLIRIFMALLMKILALDILSPLIRGGVKAGINN